MFQGPEEDAARSLSTHLSMDPRGGVVGVTTGTEPELVVFLYKRRNRHWPEPPIPASHDGYPVVTRKVGRPVAAI